MYKSYIKGIGAYLPEKILSNKDLEKMVDTSDEWILSRTGISERRIAAADESSSDLGVKATLKAIKDAGIDKSEIDFIFFATTSPDQIMPNSASVLQHKLGLNTCGALDIAAACTGFLYGLSIADQMIKTGAYKNILVVGAEIISRYVDYEDRTTCILFGDGAGAAIISRSEDSNTSEIMGHKLSADGSLGDLLTILGGGSKRPASHQTVDEKLHLIQMNGREIFKNAVRAMSGCSKDVLDQTNTKPSQVDWLIPHQANTRIIEAVAKHFDFSMDKVILNIEKMGNNSSATIPISFVKAIGEGKIKRGQLVMLTAFGGGLTSGSLLMRY